MAPLPFRRAAVLLAAALTAAGCAQPFSADTAGQGPLRVGLLVPGTGGDDTQAPSAEEGARLAVDVVNQATSSVPLPLARAEGLTGLGGSPARLVLDRRVDAMSTAQVERLTKDQDVDVLVGVGGREDLLATSQQAERLEVPYVGGGASSGFLTERGLEWFFHTAPSDEELGLSFMNVLERRPGAGGGSGSVALLHPGDTEGTAVAQDVAEAVEKRGYSSVLAPVNPAQRDDVAAQTGALEAALAEGDVAGVVLVARHPDSARTAAEAAADAAVGSGVSAVLGVGEGFTDAGVQDSVAERLPGVLVSAPWPSDTAGRNLTASSVAELFRKRFGHRMDASAAQAFTATYTALRAASAAGSTDREQLRASLSAVEVSGRELVMAWDGVRFDPRHRNVAARGSLEQVSASGSVLVEPEDLARGDVAWGVGDARGA